MAERVCYFLLRRSALSLLIGSSSLGFFVCCGGLTLTVLHFWGEGFPFWKGWPSFICSGFCGVPFSAPFCPDSALPPKALKTFSLTSFCLSRFSLIRSFIFSCMGEGGGVLRSVEHTSELK